MSHYTYLIIGGGMAANAAVLGIREVDSVGSVGIISAEGAPPYKRPPLSKSLWKGRPLEDIWYNLENLGVKFHLERTVKAIDGPNKRLVDEKGTNYTFEKLLMATGGTPRRFPFGDDRVIYYRTVADYRRLRALSEGGGRFAVVGGGFIGMEIAAALAMNGKDVVMVFPDEAIGSRLFPRELGIFLNGFYREKGVEVIPETSITGIGLHGERIVVKTRDKKTSNEFEIPVDGVVAGIGVSPNVELAREMGLAVERLGTG